MSWAASVTDLEAFSADEGYPGTFVEYVEQALRRTVVISKKIKDAWTVLPKRWVVERTFSWFGPCRRLAKDYEIKTTSSHLQIQLGHARAQLGRATEGIVLIRQGIDGLLKIAPHPGLTSFFNLLATAQQRAGETDGALENIEQALRVNPEAILARPEALRIRGELRHAKGQASPAEADFRESIAFAHSMGAKMFELHATMSLARLLTSQGRCNEARVMLAEIYNWFTEGFDTPDLKDAKALLDQLQS